MPSSTGKKGKKGGATYGSAKSQMVASAGKDHVIFSKKLLMIIGLILLVSLFIFFSVEQSLIASNLAVSRASLAQNNLIRDSNEKLDEAKEELQDEEDELVNMYSKWLDEDNEEIDASEEELKELQAQFKQFIDTSGAHSQGIKDKAETLNEKEKRLQNYQFKIQQKQKFLDEMAVILKGLNKTAPNTAIDAEPDEFIWDDEEFADDDYYVEYYTGDDDWMSDEEWY